MSLCFYYQQIYNIMKYNLFDNFYEVIDKYICEKAYNKKRI